MLLMASFLTTADISGLIAQHPTLARDFDFLRQELDSPFPSSESSSDTSIDHLLQIQQAAIRRRHKVAKDLDDILQKIRQKPRNISCQQHKKDQL